MSSGTELAETALTEQPSLRVLFMSGYTDDTLQRYADFDMDTGFLDKPFTAERLLDQVRRALDAEVTGAALPRDPPDADCA